MSAVRAVIKTGPGPGCRLVEGRAEPDLRPDEVRVQVAAASVCGTDAALFAAGTAGSGMTMRFPVTMGHEVAGTVVEVGARAGGLRVGDRVAVETHLHCGECFFCRNGASHNCARLELRAPVVKRMKRQGAGSSEMAADVNRTEQQWDSRGPSTVGLSVVASSVEVWTRS